MGEYGGGAATAYGGFVYFSNFGDFRVYKLDAANGGDPVAVTPGNFSTAPSAVRSSDDETPGVDGDLQRTETTDSRISLYCRPILTSSLGFLRTIHTRPHRRSKPPSYLSIHPPRPSRRLSPERTFTPRLDSRPMGSTYFGRNGTTQICLGKARRFMSQR